MPVSDDSKRVSSIAFVISIMPLATDDLPDAATYAARLKQQLSVQASLNDLDIIEMPDAKKLKRMGRGDEYDSVGSLHVLTCMYMHASSQCGAALT